MFSMRDISVQCHVMSCTCKRMNCSSISSIFEDEIADKITISMRIGLAHFPSQESTSMIFLLKKTHECGSRSALKSWFYRQFRLQKSTKWTSNSSACRCTSWRGIVRWRHGSPRIENIGQWTSRITSWRRTICCGFIVIMTSVYHNFDVCVVFHMQNQTWQFLQNDIFHIWHIPNM